MNTKSAVEIGVLCLCLVVVSACAAGAHAGSQETSASRDLITESELAEVDAVDAYNAVRQLRPMWLRSRGAASLRGGEATLPTVYVDNMRFGELASLQNISLDDIAEIRYINGPDATIRWGTGVVGGVIEVIRKR